MSLRALFEIVVHLESFRNIDLFYQGLYYIKVSLHNKKNDEVSINHDIPTQGDEWISDYSYSCTMLIHIVFFKARSHKRSNVNLKT